MFKKEIIRILKDEGVYSEIMNIYNSKPSFKETLDSLINTPFIDNFFEYINLHFRFYTKTSIDKLYGEYKNHFSKKYKSILIKNIDKGKCEDLKKYLYDNGIIWNSGDNIYGIDIFKYPSVCLMICDGRLTWSKSADFAYGNLSIKVVSVDEFYPLFEDFKEKLKEYYKNVDFNNYK